MLLPRAPPPPPRLSPREPCHPPAAYVGGKKQLARRLVAMIEATPHDRYAEPFVGMGGVFLRRTKVPAVEVINDFNRDVATLFRVLQRHYQALMDMLKWQLTSRAEFDRLRAMDPDHLTDLERAARFLYLQRLAFGGKVAGRSFGISKDRPGRFNIVTLEPLLEAIHERMASVTIECLDWSAFITRWDDPGTLFYVDPPYYGTEHFCDRALFSRDDQAALSAALRGIKGKFILTLNDLPETRALYKGCTIEGASLSYTVGGAHIAKAVGEIVVSGGGRRRRG